MILWPFISNLLYICKIITLVVFSFLVQYFSLKELKDCFKLTNKVTRYTLQQQQQQKNDYKISNFDCNMN